MCFFDCEATGLKGDYNSILVISIKPFGGKIRSFSVKAVGNDQKIVRDAKEYLEQFDAWCGYYSKAFDIKIIDTRLLRWGHPPVDKRHHLDLYFCLKANTVTARRSQGHLLSWLGAPESKMTVSADVWASMSSSFKDNIQTMIKRCESDVKGLEALYRRTRHLVRDISR